MSTTNAHTSLCGQKLLRDILYQLKLIKMRAELANLNDCAVPFFKPRRRQLVLVLPYIIKTLPRFHLSIGLSLSCNSSVTKFQVYYSYTDMVSKNK